MTTWGEKNRTSCLQGRDSAPLCFHFISLDGGRRYLNFGSSGRQASHAFGTERVSITKCGVSIYFRVIVQHVGCAKSSMPEWTQGGFRVLDGKSPRTFKTFDVAAYI